MNIPNLDSADGPIHKIACDIDQVINVLIYAERDPATGYEPSCLIKTSINQLLVTLKDININFGKD